MHQEGWKTSAQGPWGNSARESLSTRCRRSTIPQTYAVLLGKTKITLTEPHLCWKNNLEKRYIALMFPVKRSKIRGNMPKPSAPRAETLCVRPA